MKKILFTFVILVLSTQKILADQFETPPTKDKSGKFYSWVSVTFPDSGTGARTTFRLWLPYTSEQIWEVLIDTNNYKKYHSGDYSDSRTLDENQFKLVDSKKPDTINGFYELIGKETFPSLYGRQKGGVWFSYTLQRFNLPWPLSDRWVVSKVKNDEANLDEGKMRYEYKGVVGNFKKLDGYWELFPAPGMEGWTEFRGSYDSDAGISVPEFLAKKIFKASIIRIAKENLKRLEELNGPPRVIITPK